MARIALVCPEFHGHLNPMLSLGAALRGRGHDVLLAGHVDAADRAARRGIPFRRIGRDDDPGWSAGATQQIARTLGRSRGHSATFYTLRALGAGCALQLRDLPAVFADERIDAALIDQVSVAAAAVAESMELPFASVANALAINPDRDVPPVSMPWGPATSAFARLRNRALNAMSEALLRWLARDVVRMRKRLGLRPFSIENSFSPALQIAQQPEWFDFPRHRRPASLEYTGPFHAPDRDRDLDFDWDRLDGRPLVYASMGTLQNGIEHVFHTIAEAVAPLDAQLVVALGGSSLALGDDLPGDPVVTRFAPQVALLRRASVAILHGGLNGTLEALAAGVPILAVPVTNDQPGVAARICHARAGAALALGGGGSWPRFGVAAVREAVQRLLADDVQRTRSRELGDDIERSRGMERAVALFEERILGREDPAPRLDDRQRTDSLRLDAPPAAAGQR